MASHNYTIEFILCLHPVSPTVQMFGIVSGTTERVGVNARICAVLIQLNRDLSSHGAQGFTMVDVVADDGL